MNLFRQSPGYLESLLLKDNAIPGRYVTVDRWISEDAHREFRASFAESYDRLDKDLGHLTVCERSLGAFSELPGGRSSEQDSSIPAPS